jgi:GAF domain-containing protein
MREHAHGPFSEALDAGDDAWRSHGEQLLVEAARLLSASGGLDAILRQAMRLVVPRLADYSIIYLRDAGGGYTQAASTHVDRAKARLLEELGRRYHPDPNNANSAVARVAGSALPLIVEPPTPEQAVVLFHDPEALRIALALEPASVAIVPLVAHNDVLGVLVLAYSESGRRYYAHDLISVELIGARVALAIDNARLYRDAQESHDRSMQAAELEAQLAHARLEALQAQLNPHFLFNALHSVGALVPHDPVRADQALESLGDLLRYTLGTEDQVMFSQEWRFTQDYLAFEQLRLGERLRIDAEATPQAMTVPVPPLILQPLVENAVRHGIADREDGGRIELRAAVRNDRLVLCVADDGTGAGANGGDGVGLTSVRQRLHALYGDAASIEIDRSSSGYSVTMGLPCLPPR